jgi:hypothetical protein
LVDDDQKTKLWMDGLEETIYPDGLDRENPVGARFRQRIKEGGRVAEYDGQVTAYDKPRHLGVRIGSSAFTMEVDYRFTETGDSTRLDYSAKMLYANWFSRLMGSLFGWFTRRILNNQMTKLKGLAESGG